MSANPSGFFRERLLDALTRRRADVSESTEVYLVHLLTKFVHITGDETLNPPLVQRLADALEELIRVGDGFLVDLEDHVAPAQARLGGGAPGLDGGDQHALGALETQLLRDLGGEVLDAHADLCKENGVEMPATLVIEKAEEVGSHQLSGAMMDPKGIFELFEDPEKLGMPYHAKCDYDAVYFMTSKSHIA